ncbi:MAG: RluA family pseudouridine synthase [Pirellulaceae bacterium]|nr:RluA family pseudouridine synthase [Pirellulaceae bacterium]
MENDLHLLYREGPCFAIWKPGGILTQAPPGIDSVELRVKRFIKRQENKEGRVYLGVPHRLDRPASGVLVLARHVRATKKISEQFQHRTVKKKYWALLEGEVQDDNGTWQDFMRKVPGQPLSEIVSPLENKAKTAILHFRKLLVSTVEHNGQKHKVTWVEIELETGRTHQIRLQTSSRGHPILGDTLYKATLPFGPQYDDLRKRSIALHARSLKLDHPMTRLPIEFTAPLPACWNILPEIAACSDLSLANFEKIA